MPHEEDTFNQFQLKPFLDKSAPLWQKHQSGMNEYLAHHRMQSIASLVTGQFSTQLPHPVHRSILMLRALFLILTLKFPAEPSTDSRSA
jgi:hypothetical protein